MVKRSSNWGKIAITVSIGIGVTLVSEAISYSYKQNAMYDLFHSGDWLLINHIQETSYRPYKNMQVAFNIHFRCHDGEIIGEGEKIYTTKDTVQSKIPHSKRTPIHLDGTLTRRLFSNPEIDFTISEKGKLRETTGSMHLKYKRKGVFQGTFSSGAADSKGDAYLFRQD